MIEVEAPDGTIVEFPDGTSPDVMSKAMQAKFSPAPVEKSGYIADMVKSFPAGVVRGAGELAMLPFTASSLLDAGVDKLAGGYDRVTRAMFGLPPRPEGELQRQTDALRERSIISAIDPQKPGRALMDATLYKPQTTPGEFSRTVGEFAVPGGIPSAATRAAPTAARAATGYVDDIVRQAAGPAVVSEGAGQVAEGTAAEPYARFGGAIAGGALATALKTASAPESVLRTAVGDMTDAQWQRALDLQNNRAGISLTGPEAIAQATGGGSGLPFTLRMVEGSLDGQSRMRPFFAARPGQVDAAVGDVFDQIAPPSANPYTVGPRVSEAATDVIDAERRTINAMTRPSYDAAAPVQVPGVGANDPAFAASLARLRSDPVLGPVYAGMPDDSVGVIDAVTKDMRDRGVALANATNPGFSSQTAALYGSGAQDARQAARAASPEYDAALAEQARLRRDVLDPLEQGPVGQVAATTDTKAAGRAILPPDPMEGAAAPIGDAVTRLTAQDADATRSLVRGNLADRYSKAGESTQNGASRENVGARFRNDVGNTEEQRAVLDAVLRGAGRPQAASDMSALLGVLEATGRRLPPNSVTAATTAANARLGTGSPLGRLFDVARTAGASWLTQAGSVAKEKALRHSIGTLADMFADPNSVQLIQQAVARGAPVVAPEIAARTALQAAPLLGER